MSRFALQLWKPCRFVMVAMIAWLASNVVTATAQSTENSFLLRISEKEMELVHTGEMAWEKYNMWDLGFERMANRNTPFLEVTNNLDTPLTEFHLTIGDDRFHFANDFLGQYALLGNSTPSFNITSATLNNAGDELIVTIGNGGLKKVDGPVRFQIDLDVDEVYETAPYNFYPHPDYRTVLFDITGVDPYGPQEGESESDPSADNAQYWAIFQNGHTITTERESFPDADIPPPYQSYYNENLRPYRLSDPVGLFEVPGGTPIPEPASAMLGLLAVAGLLCGRRRSRDRSPAKC